MGRTIDWILVTDRCKARILQSPVDSKGHFTTQASLNHPEGRLHRSEMESDSPGSFSLQGGSRTSAQPHEDPDHHESRKFADELCDYLDQACVQNQFDRLIIVAPPRFLGVLREQLPARLQARLAGEFDLDLAGLTESQLQPRIEQLLGAMKA